MNNSMLLFWKMHCYSIFFSLSALNVADELSAVFPRWLNDFIWNYHF